MTVALDSPHNRNALSAALVSELLVALHEARSDPDVRAVVLTGTGEVFCSGADLSERRQDALRQDALRQDALRQDGLRQDGLRQDALRRDALRRDALRRDGEGGSPDLEDGPEESGATFAEVLSCLAELPQPVVARVNGHVRGGGIGLVASCDLAVAPASATFAFKEVRVGVAPAMIAVPVLRIMDRRSFVRWALTGDTFSAADAAAAGLLSAVVEDGLVDTWVTEVLASFHKSSPLAMAATKSLVEGLIGREWEPAMASAEALSDELFRSSEAAEGMAAFFEHRSPSWAGRHPVGWTAPVPHEPGAPGGQGSR